MKSGAVALFLASRSAGRWLFLVVRDPGNHEFPDLIFSKSYGKSNTVNVSRSRSRTRYDSSNDIKTIYLGTVFLYVVNIL